MYFVTKNVNPYKNLYRNLIKVYKAGSTLENYTSLYNFLNKSLKEDTSLLVNNLAFAERILHWNQIDSTKITKIHSKRNPWLNLKKALEKTINTKNTIYIEKELAWFNETGYKEDWLV